MILDIGCGKEKRGDVGMDMYPAPGVDIVWDLRKTPWPIESEKFDTVVARHVLEHIPWSEEAQYGEALFRVMDEVHRILKPGGVFHIETPHADSVRALGVPTHRRVFREFTFSYFSRDIYHEPCSIEPERHLFSRCTIAVDREFGNPLGWNDWHVEHHLPRLYRVINKLRIGRKRNLTVELFK